MVAMIESLTPILYLLSPNDTAPMVYLYYLG